MTATALGALFIILVGVVLRRAGVLRREDGPALVRIVLYAGLPALVFLILIRADLDAELGLVPVAAWIVHGVMLATCFGIAALWSMDRPLTGAFVTATAVGNTGFFGLPLIAASGAGVSLPAAVMYDALGTGIMTFTTTVVIASAFGERGGGAAVVWGRLWRALSLPPMWALVIGIAVNLMGVDELPRAVERPLELLSAAVLPLVMLYAGLIIDARDLRRRTVSRRLRRPGELLSRDRAGPGEIAFRLLTRLGRLCPASGVYPLSHRLVCRDQPDAL